MLDGDWKETHPSLHSLSDTEDGEGSVNSVENEDPKSTASLQEELASMKIPTSPRASFYTAHFTLDHADTSTDFDSSPSAKARFRNSLTRERIRDEDKERSIGLGEMDTQAEMPQNLYEEGDMVGRLKRLATPPPPSSHPTQDDVEDGTKEPGKTPQVSPKKHIGKGGRIQKQRNVIAIIDLSEEEASTFQDFLCLVYPSE